MKQTADNKKKRGRPAANKQIDKSLLLDIAVKEFATHGFEGAKLKDIAQQVGIANSLMNYHFESKEDLWQQAVAQLGEKLKNRFKEIHFILQDIEGIAAVKAYTRQYIYFSAEHPEFFKIIFHEMCTATDRADWILSNILTPLNNLFVHNTAVSDKPTLNINGFPVANLTSIIIGASNIFFVYAFQMNKIYQINPFDQQEIEKHADIVVELLFKGLEQGFRK